MPFYYESKYAFDDGGAKGWTKNNNKNVLIQRGRKIWRAIPEGKVEELKEDIHYSIIKESN